jgi:hypothetical protein
MLVLTQCDFVNLVDTNTFQMNDKNIVLLKNQDIFFFKIIIRLQHIGSSLVNLSNLQPRS